MLVRMMDVVNGSASNRQILALMNTMELNPSAIKICKKMLEHRGIKVLYDSYVGWMFV